MRVQDVGFSGKPDPEVLKWAVIENRILITHDVCTIPPLALEWMNENRPILGIFLVELSHC